MPFSHTDPTPSLSSRRTSFTTPSLTSSHPLVRSLAGTNILPTPTSLASAFSRPNTNITASTSPTINSLSTFNPLNPLNSATFSQLNSLGSRAGADSAFAFASSSTSTSASSPFQTISRPGTAGTSTGVDATTSPIFYTSFGSRPGTGTIEGVSGFSSGLTGFNGAHTPPFTSSRPGTSAGNVSVPGASRNGTGTGTGPSPVGSLGGHSYPYGQGHVQGHSPNMTTPGSGSGSGSGFASTHVTGSSGRSPNPNIASYATLNAHTHIISGEMDRERVGGPPSNEDIEAIIQMATNSSAGVGGGRLGGSQPPRDTRTQLFVGNLPYRIRWQDLKDLFRRAGTVLRADVSLGPDNRSRGYGTVLLATAEDAGRAVDMFNGFEWMTRVLEVRPDRMGGIGTVPGGVGVGGSGGHGGMAEDGFGGGFVSVGVGTSGRGNVAGSGSPFVKPFGGGSAGGSGAGTPGFGGAGGAGGLGGEEGDAAGRCLFVGNLPFHIQWQDLKDLFRMSGGTILRADVALGVDGRSRGFGMVSFGSEADAERARAMFNGYEYNGRVLKVHFDKFGGLANHIHATSNSLTSSGMPGLTAAMGGMMSPSPLSLSTPQSPTAPGGGLSFSVEGLGGAGGSSIASSSPFLAHASSQHSSFAQQILIGQAQAQQRELRERGREREARERERGMEREAGAGWGGEWETFRYNLDDALGPSFTARSSQTHIHSHQEARNSLMGGDVYDATAVAAAVFGKQMAATEAGSYVKAKSALEEASEHESYASATAAASSPLSQTETAGLGRGDQQDVGQSSFEFGGYGAGASSNSAGEHGNGVAQGVEAETTLNGAAGEDGRPSSGSSYSNDRDREREWGLRRQEFVSSSQHPPQSSSSSTATSSSLTSGQQQSRSQQQHHHHPAHPGPIALPPPPSVTTFPMPPQHTLSPYYIHPHLISPYGSPLYHPMHMGMTPHGLPPITPSMPSFTFLPQPSPHIPPMAGSQYASVLTSGAGDGGEGEALPGDAPVPLPSHQPRSHSPTHPTHHLPHPYHTHALHLHHQQHQQQQSQSDAPIPSGPMPGYHPHHPHPHHPLHHHHSLASALPHPHMFSPFTPFSPGVAMSPGALWNRGGGATGHGNAFINPAVGAPVRPQQPQLSTPQQQQSQPQPPLSPHGGYNGMPVVSEEIGYFPPVEQLVQGLETLGGEGKGVSGESESYFPPMPPSAAHDISPDSNNQDDDTGRIGRTTPHTNVTANTVSSTDTTESPDGDGEGGFESSRVSSSRGTSWHSANVSPRPPHDQMMMQQVEGIMKGLDALGMTDPDDSTNTGKDKKHAPQQQHQRVYSFSTSSSPPRGSLKEPKQERSANGTLQRAESDPVSHSVSGELLWDRSESTQGGETEKGHLDGHGKGEWITVVSGSSKSKKLGGVSTGGHGEGGQPSSN